MVEQIRGVKQVKRNREKHKTNNIRKFIINKRKSRKQKKSVNVNFESEDQESSKDYKDS